MDIGGITSTAILFGFYDWDQAAIVIEKEWVCDQNTVTSDVIASVVNDTCEELGYDQDKTTMIADNNNVILLQDLFNDHGIAFYPTAKDNLQAQVNKVKRWMKEGRIIVNEDCLQLVGCIKGAIWTKDRSKFAMSKTFGHYDALAALIYLIRNVDESENPPEETLDPNKYQFEEQPQSQHPLAKAFGRRMHR